MTNPEEKLPSSDEMKDFTVEWPTETGVYLVETVYGDKYQRVWCQPWNTWLDANPSSAARWRPLRDDEEVSPGLSESVAFIRTWNWTK